MMETSSARGQATHSNPHDLMNSRDSAEAGPEQPKPLRHPPNDGRYRELQRRSP